MAVDPITGSDSGNRGTVSALASALLHALALVILAATPIRTVGKDRQVIPLVIREPAPPPPPPGGGGGPPAAGMHAPVEPPRPVDQPKPVEAPRRIEPPKIAARPKPTAKRNGRPTPAAASPPTPEPANAAAVESGNRGGGVAGGVIGGVRGGEVGGRVGGRLGGSGNDVWQADQVAVPPKVIERVLPQYPAMARARGQEGIVVVQAVIDRDGRVKTDALRVIASQPPFDDAAVIAFRQWRFQPGRDDRGRTVRVLVQQQIRFRLR